MIALVLIKKIFSLFIVMLLGFLVVKSKLLKSEDSRILSVLLAYLILPCVTLVAFQVECTEEVLRGLGLAAAASLTLAAGQLLISRFCLKPLRLTPEEHSSILYPNAGNLVIPLILAILDSSYIIYTTPFMAAQLFLLWSHCKSIICGERKPNFVKVFTNPNILAIIAGILMFSFQIHLPATVYDALDSIGTMVGPCSMLVTGMLLGGTDFKKIFKYKRLPFVVSGRLLIMPAIFILIFKLIGIERLSANSAEIMLIAMLTASTPTANAVTQFTQIFGGDAEYANVIALATTVLCIITIPAVVAVYQII